MLEDVNSVLNAGEIPNLFMPDEVSTIATPSAPAPSPHLPRRHTCPIGTPARSAHFHHRRPIGTLARAAHVPHRHNCAEGSGLACVGVGVGGCWRGGGNDGSRARTRR